MGLKCICNVCAELFKEVLENVFLQECCFVSIVNLMGLGWQAK